MNAVYVRIAVYGLTSVAMLIPAGWAGMGVHFDSATHMLSVNLDALGAALVAGLGANAAIFAKWGVR